MSLSFHKLRARILEKMYKPSFEAQMALQTASDLDKGFLPVPSTGRRRKVSMCKKKKQMKIERGFRNQAKGPTNFQGAPLDKCVTVGDMDVPVFVHEKYAKAWKRKKKETGFVELAGDSAVCQHCLLLPCSVRLFGRTLREEAHLPDTQSMSYEDRTEKLRIRYRVHLIKLQGKRFVTKQMKCNDQIPACAARATSEIASQSVFTNSQHPDSFVNHEDNGATKTGRSYLSEEEECF